MDNERKFSPYIDELIDKIKGLISEQNIHSENVDELFEILLEKFGEDVYPNPVTGAGIMGGYYGDEAIALEGLQKREDTVINVIPSYFTSYSRLVKIMLYPVEVDTLIRESFLDQALQHTAEEVMGTKIHDDEK